MDSEMKDKLSEMVKNGSIDQNTFDEILERWNSEKVSAPDDSGKRGEKRSRSIRVSGSSHLSDVFADELHVSGSVHVDGNVDSSVIRISGSGHFEGDVKSGESMEVSGVANVNGDISAKSVASSGSLVGKSIVCMNLESSGSLKVTEGLVSDTVDSSGSLASRSITGKEIRSSGSIRAGLVEGSEIYISGMVKSDHVKCRRIEIEVVGGKSEIGTLETDVSDIRRGGWRSRSDVITIDEVKCTRGYFEGLRSKSVVGEDLVFSEGCKIEYAEGKTIKEEKGAMVKEKKVL